MLHPPGNKAIIPDDAVSNSGINLLSWPGGDPTSPPGFLLPRPPIDRDSWFIFRSSPHGVERYSSITGVWELIPIPIP
jgi:hypothetical protein